MEKLFNSGPAVISMGAPIFSNSGASFGTRKSVLLYPGMRFDQARELDQRMQRQEASYYCFSREPHTLCASKLSPPPHVQVQDLDESLRTRSPALVLPLIISNSKVWPYDRAEYGLPQTPDDEIAQIRPRLCEIGEGVDLEEVHLRFFSATRGFLCGSVTIFRGAGGRRAVGDEEVDAKDLEAVGLRLEVRGLRGGGSEQGGDGVVHLAGQGGVRDPREREGGQQVDRVVGRGGGGAQARVGQVDVLQPPQECRVAAAAVSAVVVGGRRRRRMGGPGGLVRRAREEGELVRGDVDAEGAGGDGVGAHVELAV